jgi:hypothetical protein
LVWQEVLRLLRSPQLIQAELERRRTESLNSRSVQRVASAIVCDGVSAAAVVFAPEYGNEDDHQIRSHICSRD